MKVIMHYPETEQGKKDLARLVAEVHAQMVIDRLRSSPYPLEQKRKMVDVLREMERE